MKLLCSSSRDLDKGQRHCCFDLSTSDDVCPFKASEVIYVVTLGAGLVDWLNTANATTGYPEGHSQ